MCLTYYFAFGALYMEIAWVKKEKMRWFSIQLSISEIPFASWGGYSLGVYTFGVIMALNEHSIMNVVTLR